MDSQHAKQITKMLPEEARVIDVGGGMAAFARADWIIDALPFDQQGLLLDATVRSRDVRFSRDTWVEFDLCNRQRWPFNDHQFDFAVCSHVLEDLRDPIWVCAEMSRIAKAGYIEVPSRALEQSLGVEHPRLAGFYHHRWLVSVENGRLEFRQKPSLLHVTRQAIVAQLGFWRALNPKYSIQTLYWQQQVPCREVLEFDEGAVLRELCEVCRRARELPDLLVRPTEHWRRRLRRAMYYCRLRWAGGA